MQKFMSVFLAATFLASAPVFAFESSVVGNEEYATPMMDESYGAIATQEDELLARRRCPRGWDRVPEYRWNSRRHRWEFAGWKCRRDRRDHRDGRGGRDGGRRNPGYPGDRGDGRGSPPPGNPGFGGERP